MLVDDSSTLSPDSTAVQPDLTRAVNAVLLELVHVLDEYRDSLVVSGGLAMHLLFASDTVLPAGEERSVPLHEPFARVTKDVDFVLKLVQLRDGYDDQSETIADLLGQAHYQQETRKQYWVKKVKLPGFVDYIEVIVEFLAPVALGSDTDIQLLRKVSAQQELRPAALDGTNLALLQPRIIHCSGQMPDGQHRTDIPIQVVAPAMLILIKAIAFADRLKKQAGNPTATQHLEHAAKHAYDISQLLLRYQGGTPALAERLLPPYITKPGPEQEMVSRALEILRNHFADRKSRGIQLMVQEGDYRLQDTDSQQIAQQGTVSRVTRLLKTLDDKAENLY